MPTFNISDDDRDIIIRAIEAARHPPKLIERVWWIWDFDSRQYVKADYSGTGSGIESIGDAADVELTDIQEGDTIVYSEESAKFVNRPSTYVHRQDSPSAKWEITHNMGKYPSVTVVTSAGAKVYGDVKYNSINKATIEFSVAFSGKAYLN